MVGRNSEQVKKMSSRMSRKQSMRRRGAEDGPEELNRKQSMGTRLAEGGPEVQRMESSSQ